MRSRARDGSDDGDLSEAPQGDLRLSDAGAGRGGEGAAADPDAAPGPMRAGRGLAAGLLAAATLTLASQHGEHREGPAPAPTSAGDFAGGARYHADMSHWERNEDGSLTRACLRVCP